MQTPIVNEQERHVLQALLSRGSMTSKQLAELCKNAFGWSNAVIRRTQKSLLKQGLVQEQNGFLTPTITKEDLENNLWDSRLQDTFEWQSPARPEQTHKQPFFRSIWFWCTCAFAMLALVLAFFLTAKQPQAPAAHEFPTELTICRDALDQWQALEDYKITAQFFRHLDSGGTTQWEEQYWVSGKDWVLLNYAPSTQSSQTPGYMCRNGIYYTAASAHNPLWIAQQSWEPSLLVIWPMDFDWDDYELIYTGTTTSDASSVVNFTAVDRSLEGVYTVYHLQFQLTLSGKLHSMAVIQLRANNVIAKDVYYLSSSNSEQVAKFIADQQKLTFSDGYVPETG